MGKFYCKKCNCKNLHTETIGNNIGLYCNDCGTWIKWLNKNELRAFEYSMREATKEEKESINNYIQDISKPNGENFFTEETIIKRLQRFVDNLDKVIDIEYENFPISATDAVRKNTYCHTLEKCKFSIINIINGREYNEYEN